MKTSVPMAKKVRKINRKPVALATKKYDDNVQHTPLELVLLSMETEFRERWTRRNGEEHD
jgi:hypothetical protein